MNDISLMIDTLKKGKGYLERELEEMDKIDDHHTDNFLETLLLVNDIEREEFNLIKDNIDVLEALDLV